MPFNKPTISHQLKAVKNDTICKPKVTSVIQNSVSTSSYSTSRSHLIQNGSNLKKSAYACKNDKEKQNMDSDIRECTKLLRNVLASDALVYKHIDIPRKNKSTSTDDYEIQRDSVKLDTSPWKTCSPRSDNNAQPHTQNLDDSTEAESIVTEPEVVNNCGSQKHKSPKGNKITYCNCQTDNQGNMSNTVKGSGDHEVSMAKDKINVCCRCKNVIRTPNPTVSFHECETSGSGVNGKQEAEVRKMFSDKENGNTRTHDMYSFIKDENHLGDKLESITHYLQSRLIEVKAVAKTTRDADLDKLVSDLEYAFQLMIGENCLLLKQMKTVAKSVKLENISYKQKIKTQNETIQELKSELKLLRHDHKQKVEEMKLNIQLKSEEIRQLSEQDATSNIHWKEKHMRQEKELSKLRSEVQAEIVKNCQKDTEMVQMKHEFSQSEARYKERIQQLIGKMELLEKDLASSKEICNRHESEIQHNQSVIRAARTQVVGLLERHRNGAATGSAVGDMSVLCNSTLGLSGQYQYNVTGNSNINSFPVQTMTQVTNQMSTKDWVQQASNLHKVLSQVAVCDFSNENTMASHTKYSNTEANRNNESSTTIQHTSATPPTALNYNTVYSPPTDVTPVGMYRTTNYNNNHASVSNKLAPGFLPVTSTESNRQVLSDLIRSSSPSNLSTSTATLSQSGRNRRLSEELSDASQFDYVLKKAHNSKDNNNIYNNNVINGQKTGQINSDPWEYSNKKHHTKMSSVTSSVLSTISSLHSTDDADFRTGLQKLDGQISRLQSTLQAKLNSCDNSNSVSVNVSNGGEYNSTTTVNAHSYI